MKIVFISVFFLLTLSAYSADWPIYKGNLYFTGNNDQIIVKNNSLKWLFMASNYIFNPIVSDGRVYFSDMDKIVYCVDEETGRQIWNLDMKAVSSHFAGSAGVPGKVKYPIIRGNSLFLSDATAIYCLDKTNGRILWARAGLQENEKKAAVIDGIYADPILSGDNLYYGTRKNFIAREVYNGHVVWSNQEIESYSGFPTYYDDKILAQSRDYKNNAFFILCLDQYTGKTIWKKQIDNPLQIFSPVVYQEKVFIPSGKKIYCLSLTDGAILWQKEYGDYITSNPSFTDREVLLTIGNQRIAVLNPDTGSVNYELDFGARSAPYYVTVNDQIYTAFNYNKNVGGKDITFTSARAYAFGDNKPIWEFLPPFPGSASQPIASRGTLFIPAGNYLYAIGTYYDRPIIFGNDGSSTLAPEESSSGTASSAAMLALADTSSSSAQSSIEWNDSSEKQSVSSVSSSQEPVKETPKHPEKPVNLEETKPGESVVVHNIYFEFDKAYLRRESISTLDDIVRQLKRNPKIKLEIQGHTDNIGTKEYNRKLSERRADAVMEYFIKNGISPERLRSRGFGETKPIADNKTEEGRSKNRRTEFLILEK